MNSRPDFDKPEKETCVNSGTINVVFDIPYQFR